jgi:ABC-2 type transport system ATP-binding protein
MIDVENLTRKFRDITAVEGLSFHVNEGEIFGFLGPNGAGKTTTVRMLACLISETSGRAKIGDYEIGNRQDRKKIKWFISLGHALHP